MSNLQPGTTMYRIGQLERVTSELRQDVRELRGALELAEQRISDLERLRPTCVICLDATADRQTVRGPACTNCVGDMPDDDTVSWRRRWRCGRPATTRRRRRASAGPRTTRSNAVDAALRELHGLRSRLIPEIRSADDAAMARTEELLRRLREEDR